MFANSEQRTANSEQLAKGKAERADDGRATRGVSVEIRAFTNEPMRFKICKPIDMPSVSNRPSLVNEYHPPDQHKWLSLSILLL